MPWHSPAMQAASTYRPDIDGLRAIAVLGVVLFHAQLGWMPGGFVGVDVFFVISGYLITGIIVAHQGSLGAFLTIFYERRIRRLIPPAIPVLVFTALFAWYLLPPAALIEFCQSLLAYAAFASNWFFLSIEGYFDGPSEMKPLLHTWSLSIEEQFYLLFPIPILLLKRYGMNAVRALLLAVFALSLAFGSYLVLAGQSDAAFYNSLGRFWEIALGGLLAVNAIPAPRRATLRQLSGLAGLAMIATSMLLYSEKTAFPGLSALVPTVGAALVILGRGSIANRVLESAPLVGVGLISYALYLWHWPIFVLIHYVVIGAEPIHFVLGTVVAVILATGSYFLTEQPVRRRAVFPLRSAAFAGFAVVSTVTLAFGSYGWSAGGSPQRFPIGQEYTAHLLATVYKTAEERQRSVCWVSSDVALQPVIDQCVKIVPGKHNVLLIGDSHAAQFYPAIVGLLPESHVSLIATDSCNLTPGAYQTCNDLTAWFEANARDADSPFDRIIISVRVKRMESAEAMIDLASAVADRGTPITVFGPIHYYRPNLPTLFPAMVDRFSPEEMDEAFDRAVQTDQFEFDAFMARGFGLTRVDYVSLIDILCRNGRTSCTHLDSEGMPITVDDTHLTAEAAANVIASITSRILVPNETSRYADRAE